MNKIYFFILLFLSSTSVKAQNIMFINDNDYITQNTDTFLLALQNSDYGTFTYFNAIDSSQMPSYADYEGFDLVIYYASTDGAALGLWDNGQAGNTALKSFLSDGGSAWIIGADILYDGGYVTPATIGNTDFAYEYMGLETYNVQSYGDDGGNGLPQVDFSNQTSTSFPDSLIWTFSTFWWADGVTPRPGATTIYKMGPSSYTLSGEVTMSHYYDFVTNVIGTYFDPALIDTPQNRINFINATLNYFTGFDLSANTLNEKDKYIKIYNNPGDKNLTVESLFNENKTFEIISIGGAMVHTGQIKPQINTLSLAQLSGGIYFLKVENSVEKFIVE